MAGEVCRETQKVLYSPYYGPDLLRPSACVKPFSTRKAKNMVMAFVVHQSLVVIILLLKGLTHTQHW